MIPKSLRRWLLLFCAVCCFPSLCFFLGCQGGPHPEKVEKEPGKIEARGALSAYGEREARSLFLRSLEAHGGKEAWSRIRGLRYTRIRSAVDADGREEVVSRFAVNTGGSEARFAIERVQSDLARLGGRAESASGARDPDAGKNLGGSANPSPELRGAALSEELFLGSLPFSLDDPSLVVEYLGAEEDLAAGRVLERVRLTWPGRGDSPSCVAWFDRTSAVLRRVFLREPGERAVLVAFSDWQEIQGVLLPMRREIHQVDRLYGRPRARRPHLADRLVGVSAELRTGGSDSS